MSRRRREEEEEDEDEDEKIEEVEDFGSSVIFMGTKHNSGKEEKIERQEKKTRNKKNQSDEEKKSPERHDWKGILKGVSIVIGKDAYPELEIALPDYTVRTMLFPVSGTRMTRLGEIGFTELMFLYIDHVARIIEEFGIARLFRRGITPVYCDEKKGDGPVLFQQREDEKKPGGLVSIFRNDGNGGIKADTPSLLKSLGSLRSFFKKIRNGGFAFDSLMLYTQSIENGFFTDLTQFELSYEGRFNDGIVDHCLGVFYEKCKEQPCRFAFSSSQWVDIDTARHVFPIAKGLIVKTGNLKKDEKMPFELTPGPNSRKDGILFRVVVDRGTLYCDRKRKDSLSYGDVIESENQDPLVTYIINNRFFSEESNELAINVFARLVYLVSLLDRIVGLYEEEAKGDYSHIRTDAWLINSWDRSKWVKGLTKKLKNNNDPEELRKFMDTYFVSIFNLARLGQRLECGGAIFPDLDFSLPASDSKSDIAAFVGRVKAFIEAMGVARSTIGRMNSSYFRGIMHTWDDAEDRMLEQNDFLFS